MSENYLLTLVKNIPRLFRRQIKLFRKPFESHAIKQSSGNETPVSLGIFAVDPLMDYRFQLAPAEIIRQAHAFTLPEPLQVGQVFEPPIPVPTLTRVLVVVLILTR